ncbi:hypothetical protein [Microterricola viridarii]|uniref:hypothetical protein n=1 Tax=Microterricola viridarii TaxID=412690 RepID=UPI0009F5112C|nr:hypothetical protein [Microterricola viridarii]
MDVRITRWYFKLLYVVGAWLLGIPVLALLNALHLPPAAVDAVSGAVSLASVLLGARIFRGRGEPVAPPRPWWKMTARPRLSRALGVLFALTPASAAAVAIAAAFGVDAASEALGRYTEAGLWTSVLALTALAALYLNSAARLRRLPALPVEPKFRTPGALR